MTKDRFIELLQEEPFRPFTVRVDGKELRITHRGMAAWHPEVVEVFIVTREGAQEFDPENVHLVTKDVSTTDE